MLKFKFSAILIAPAIALALSCAWPTAAAAQTPAAKTSAPNDLQRAVQIWNYKMAGDSGAPRGEVIYFYKCWVCHNTYTEGGPKLKDLYKHPKLWSGDPVNDGTVSKQIKDGSPRMPSFRTTLADSDVADLLSYLRDGNCCFEGINPPPNPWYRAATQKQPAAPLRGNLSGGARGIARLKNGDPLEGIMVQLIASSGVRTTVYSNGEGRFEFPKLPAALYTLRIAKPLEVLPYQRDALRIDGAMKLDDIVLERRSETEFLPATPEVQAQLSGGEWLWNLAGTSEEKRTFSNTCGVGCHSFQQIFRNRYDERSWRLIVERMMHYAGSPIIVRTQGRGNAAQEEMIVQWLTKVRGPDSKLSPLMVFPAARGAATRVVVTEYELPRVIISPHDVHSDSKGDIWYTSHRTPNLGKVDPRTGIATEYPVPITPGALPGTHRVQIDKRDILWLTENWAHNLVRFDPATGKFTKIPLASTSALNSPMGGNMAVAPDGYIWKSRDGVVDKLDPETGKSLAQFPLTKVPSTYDDIVSDDGKFWAGAAPAGDGKTVEMLNIQTGKMVEPETFSRHSTGARGGFDLLDNAWFGGRGGPLIELENKTGRAREFWPPNPYSVFYEAMPDKNGEVWAGEWQGVGFLRFNPKNERWTEYVMPEPYGQDRRTWIDNSTDPVSVWYVDNNGYMLRIQPLE